MKTVKELIEFRANTHPDRQATSFEEISVTYKEINDRVNILASFLQSFGLAKGDRIGVLDYNTLEVQDLLFASSKIGVIPIILNWRLTSSDMEFILKDSEVKFFLYGKEFIEIAKQVNVTIGIKKLELVTTSIDDVKVNSNYPEVNIYPEDIFVQLYTSGTTGLPKGVSITHKNMISVLRNLSIELPGFGADTVNLVCAPYFHIGGVGYSLLGHYIGGENILVRKFDPKNVAKIIETKKITNALLVPAMIQAILNLPNILKYDFSSLRNIQFGGSPISEIVLEKANEIFNCNFTKAYGLTETTGIASLLRFDALKKGLSEKASHKDKVRLASVGKPSPEMEIIVKLENGKEAMPNEMGEVCIRGEYLFSGYWNRKELNESSFDSEGWFYSGDIGKLDEEGFLYLFDRKNDMILSKSENIYPIEVEQVLAAHPSIDDIAIAGMPDEEFGEIVTAFIVSKQAIKITLEEIRAFAKNKLASYKIPRKIQIVREIPRNPSGKIMRNELKQGLY